MAQPVTTAIVQIFATARNLYAVRMQKGTSISKVKKTNKLHHPVIAEVRILCSLMDCWAIQKIYIAKLSVSNRWTSLNIIIQVLHQSAKYFFKYGDISFPSYTHRLKKCIIVIIFASLSYPCQGKHHNSRYADAIRECEEGAVAVLHRLRNSFDFTKSVVL